VFYSNSVPKTHHFRDIWLQKCRDWYLENRVRVCRGHWKCRHSIQRIRLPTDILWQIWLGSIKVTERL